MDLLVSDGSSGGNVDVSVVFIISNLQDGIFGSPSVSVVPEFSDPSLFDMSNMSFGMSSDNMSRDSGSSNPVQSELLVHSTVTVPPDQISSVIHVSVPNV